MPPLLLHRYGEIPALNNPLTLDDLRTADEYIEFVLERRDKVPRGVPLATQQHLTSAIMWKERMRTEMCNTYYAAADIHPEQEAGMGQLMQHPGQMQQALQQSLHDGLAGVHERMDNLQANMQQMFTDVQQNLDQSFAGMEARLTGIEGRLIRIEERLTNIEADGHSSKNRRGRREGHRDRRET
ncbi:hypothetical protein DACRYDRAFT_21982 [Dacryopinax primogenitus]|uniref:t-SNARE coiled-coil homology domain-containing protein n=1 Tax=Dacryopinax primogenitus (strain DJM 731) TaxID=1858805 RepID=M5GDD2_DACPD|nr:uncharacterized protein DACRYDRAFT_21982 [Dacryopinax primogenitus]EJU02278.1 hypothetical protein DACRYDRAFT_21982 [Dacryopinax primogenitus]